MKHLECRIKRLRLLILYSVLSTLYSQSLAQGGGPPMLTDDPGTPGQRRWEINTSINSNLTNQIEYEIPLVDLNYGYKSRTQFKLEIPVLFDETEKKNFTGSVGNPLAGIKFRFLDEAKNFISVSTYPQVAIGFRQGEENKYKLPLQFQKTFVRITFGEEIGVYYSGNSSSNSFLGNLISYKISNTWETMGEWYILNNLKDKSSRNGFINFGIRYLLKLNLSILASAGTQLVTPADESRERFFSYLGVQWRFGAISHE